MLRDKKIILGITGSIAAYKTPALVRLLVKQGAHVQVVMTPAARDFVTPLTLSTLSGYPVLCEPFDRESGEWTSHVGLGLWADMMLIAPLSANTLGKMAGGIADNLLLTTYLSAKCPVFFAPAMDLDMYKHPTTKQNITRLREFGNHLIEPAEGELASGLCGEGRMEEPENIVKVLEEYCRKEWDLAGKRVLVSAGPTYENIDPVRFVGNYSSGKMGYAIATEFAERGASVTLVSGPSSLKAPDDIRFIPVRSAEEMYVACMEHFKEADIVVMAAAVADYTPATPKDEKIKKTGGELLLSLRKTTDILAEMGKQKKDQFLAGFALETEDQLANAKDKLKRKNLDLIVMNSPRDEGAGFGTETNKVTLITREQEVIPLELKLKYDVAIDVVDKIRDMIQ